MFCTSEENTNAETDVITNVTPIPSPDRNDLKENDWQAQRRMSRWLWNEWMIKVTETDSSRSHSFIVSGLRVVLTLKDLPLISAFGQWFTAWRREKRRRLCIEVMEGGFRFYRLGQRGWRGGWVLEKIPELADAESEHLLKVVFLCSWASWKGLFQAFLLQVTP